MIAVIQRVSSASCQVDEEYTGKIKKGLLVFVGFDSNDTQIEIEKMVKIGRASCRERVLRLV